MKISLSDASYQGRLRVGDNVRVKRTGFIGDMIEGSGRTLQFQKGDIGIVEELTQVDGRLAYIISFPQGILTIEHKAIDQLFVAN